MKSKLITVLLLFLIISISFCNLIWWGINKRGFHLDELYSYEFVSCVEYHSINEDRPEASYLNTWHDAAYFEDYLIVSDDEAFDIKGTVAAIREDVHPPLFYILLELSCSLFSRNSFSKWTGIGLNILFFIITILFLYLVARDILGSSKWALVTCALYGVSVGLTNTVVFIRMYMILTCASVIFMYANLRLLKQYDRNNDKKGLWFGYLFLILSTVFGLMTQYYFLIYAFFVCLAFWMILIARKQWKHVACYALSMAVGLLFSVVIWPELFFDLVTGNQGKQSLMHWQAYAPYPEVLRSFLRRTDRILFGGYSKYIALVLSALAVICVLKILYELISAGGHKAIENTNDSDAGKIFDRMMLLTILLIFVSISLFCLIIRIAPYKEERYIMNLYPFIILIVVSLLKKVLTCLSVNRIITVAAVIGLAFCVLSGYRAIKVSNLYREQEKNIALLRNEYSEMPVILVTMNNHRAVSAVNAVCFRYCNGVYPVTSNDFSRLPEGLNENKASGYLIFISSEVPEREEVLHDVADSVGGRLEEKPVFHTKRDATYVMYKDL